MYLGFQSVLHFSFWRYNLLLFTFKLRDDPHAIDDPLVDDDTSASVLKCVVKHLGCRNSMRRGIISCDITCGGAGAGAEGATHGYMYDVCILRFAIHNHLNLTWYLVYVCGS